MSAELFNASLLESIFLALLAQGIRRAKADQHGDAAAQGRVGIRVRAMRTGKAEQALAATRVGGFFGDIAALEDAAAGLLRRGAEGDSEEDGDGCYCLFHCMLLFSCSVWVQGLTSPAHCSVVPTGLALWGLAYPMLAGVDTTCLISAAPTGLALRGLAYPMLAGVDTACLIAVAPTGLALRGLAYPMLAGVDTACLIAVAPTGLVETLSVPGFALPLCNPLSKGAGGLGRGIKNTRFAFIVSRFSASSHHCR